MAQATPDTADQIDSLVTLLALAGVNVDAEIVGDWTAGDMEQAAAWAYQVIQLADHMEGELVTEDEIHDGAKLLEIPNCLHGWLETARQIGGTAGCVRELIHDRKHWAELDGDEPEQAHTTQPERTESMAKKQFPARFSAVAIQDEHYKLTTIVEKDRLSLETADELFARKQLTGEIAVTTDGEDADQVPLFKDGLPSWSGTFQTKGYRVSDTEFSVGFLLPKDSVDIKSLEEFRKRQGKIIVKKMAEIPDEEKNGEADGDRTVFGDDKDE